MEKNEQAAQPTIESGRPIKVNSTQITLHPVLGENNNFQHNEKTYQKNFSKKVLEALSKTIILPAVVRKTKRKISEYFIVGNIAEFSVLEAAGFETFNISILDFHPDEVDIIIANLFQPLIIKRNPESTIYLAAKQNNIYEELELKGEDLGFFVSDGRGSFPEINGFSRQGAHKTAASLVVTEKEQEFLKCLNLNIKSKKEVHSESQDIEENQ